MCLVLPQIRYPNFMKPSAKDLISQLLQTDLTKRFGNLKDGVDDIKNHKWFAGVDWEAMKELNAPPPFLPTVGGADDTSNFQKYDEDPDVLPKKGDVDQFQEIFKDW